MDSTEKITDDVIRYPEYRRRLKICKLAVLLPLCTVALNIIAGIVSIGVAGGFSVDNPLSASLYMEVFLWTIFTGVFSFLCLLNMRAPCILSMIAFIVQTVFCTPTGMKVFSFVGVMVSLVTLYYVMEHNDLAKLKGYPLFREEVEFFHPTRTAEMQIDAKAKMEERRQLEESENLEKQRREEEFRLKIEQARKNKEQPDSEDKN